MSAVKAKGDERQRADEPCSVDSRRRSRRTDRTQGWRSTLGRRVPHAGETLSASPAAAGRRRGVRVVTVVTWEVSVECAEVAESRRGTRQRAAANAGVIATIPQPNANRQSDRPRCVKPAQPSKADRPTPPVRHTLHRRCPSSPSASHYAARCLQASAFRRLATKERVARLPAPAEASPRRSRRRLACRAFWPSGRWAVRSLGHLRRTGRGRTVIADDRSRTTHRSGASRGHAGATPHRDAGWFALPRSLRRFVAKRFGRDAGGGRRHGA